MTKTFKRADGGGGSSKPKHLLSIRDLGDKTEILNLLSRVRDFDGRPSHSFQGKVLACLFMEPSTRTARSFEAAMLRHGGHAMMLAGAGVQGQLSMAKGEGLGETVQVLGAYADAVVLRHPESRAVHHAAALSPVPVINGGDGAGEHPTQAILDAYTMMQQLGRDTLAGLVVTIVGDLKYGRTTHSLHALLSAFGGDDVQINHIRPESLAMPYQAAGGRKPDREAEGWDLDILKDTDVLYMTRMQRERLGWEVDGYPALTEEECQWLPSGSIIMHPGPVLGEVSEGIKSGHHGHNNPWRWVYHAQVANGPACRAAVLDWVFQG